MFLDYGILTKFNLNTWHQNSDWRTYFNLSNKINCVIICTGMRLLLAFSIQKNFYKLLETCHSELTFIHGIRVILTFLVVMDHVLYFSIIGPLANPAIIEKVRIFSAFLCKIYVLSNIKFIIIL